VLSALAARWQMCPQVVTSDGEMSVTMSYGRELACEPAITRLAATCR
jgi:hypothetical protein